MSVAEMLQECGGIDQVLMTGDLSKARMWRSQFRAEVATQFTEVAARLDGRGRRLDYIPLVAWSASESEAVKWSLTLPAPSL